jgi:hypothetical protein
MTSAAVSMLPQAAIRACLNDSVRVHLVLTGPGGGTWDIAVGHSTSVPTAVTIVRGRASSQGPLSRRDAVA